MSYKIVVEKGSLRFSAAHFITFGGKCERLHGHNYAVSVELAGELTDDGYVFDFVELKRIVREVCDALDHYFLIPMHSQHLTVRQDEKEWEVRFGERRYLFPAQDVLPLPVDNITAERLASYICAQVLDKIQAQGAANPAGLSPSGRNLSSITVGVEEAEGQTAYYSREWRVASGE